MRSPGPRKEGTGSARSRRGSKRAARFAAEAAYADSVLRTALGDYKSAVAALDRALDFSPTYAPAIFSLGTVKYQRGNRTEGRRLFESLLSLPRNTPDLCQIIDEAGTFLIQSHAYKDGLDFYRAAASRFPRVAPFHQGVGCCAGHRGYHDEALEASRRAVQIEPSNQRFVNDLGWSLLDAGDLREAEKTLIKAVSMDPSDELARENLRFCRAKLSPVLRRKRNANPLGEKA